MINSLRTALANSALQLSWSDLSQHPLALNKPVSWLQLSSVETFPNKPSEITVSGRVVYWGTDLEDCEEYILDVVAFLKGHLLGTCIPDVSRIQLSAMNIAYAGSVEDSDLDVLESYTLTLTFNLVATLEE